MKDRKETTAMARWTSSAHISWSVGNSIWGLGLGEKGNQLRTGGKQRGREKGRRGKKRENTCPVRGTLIIARRFATQKNDPIRGGTEGNPKLDQRTKTDSGSGKTGGKGKITAVYGITRDPGRNSYKIQR